MGRIESGAAAAFNAWNDGIDGAATWSLPRIGRHLLWIGAGAIPAGMFLTPPWVVGGVITALVGAILSRAPLHRLTVTWIGLAFAAWLMITVGLAALRKQPGAEIPGTVYGWLALPLVAAAALDPRWRRWAIRVMISVGVLVVVIGVLQFSVGLGLKGFFHIDPNGERWYRGRGMSALNIPFGFVCALLGALMALPAGVWGISRAWSWAGRFASLIGVGICRSRAAYAGFTLGISAAIAARGRRWLLPAAVICAVLGGAFVSRMANADSVRLQRTLDGDDGRRPIWQTTLAMIAEHPVTGLGGRDAYKLAYNEVYDRTVSGRVNKFAKRGGAPHAHNWMLALAAEHGIFAPALHLLLIGAVVFFCWRRRSSHGSGWQVAAGVATVGFVSSLFEPFPIQSVPGLGFHACLGIGLGLSLQRDGAIPGSTG